jgi:hypothetical protein
VKSLLGLAALLAAGLAQGQELTPPPPPPPVEVPPEAAVPPVDEPPPPPVTPQPQPEAAPPRQAEPVFSTVRFAPTAKLMFLGYNGGGALEGVVFGPSLRGGVRFSVTPRSPETYGWSVGVAMELGLEGLGFLPYGPQIFGFGITLKFGPAAITRGGLYFPFFDFYLLYTAVPSRFGFAQKLGVGLNFNLIALLAKESGGSGGTTHWGSWGSLGGSGGYGAVALAVLLSVLMPAVELVWTPPTSWIPFSTLEIRFGAGF